MLLPDVEQGLKKPPASDIKQQAVREVAQAIQSKLRQKESAPSSAAGKPQSSGQGSRSTNSDALSHYHSKVEEMSAALTDGDEGQLVVTAVIGKVRSAQYPVAQPAPWLLVSSSCTAPAWPPASTSSKQLAHPRVPSFLALAKAFLLAEHWCNPIQPNLTGQFWYCLRGGLERDASSDQGGVKA